MIPVGAGCYRYPAVSPSPAVPSRWVDETPAGWDAGAHSADQLNGDLRLTFDVNGSIGVVCGFTPASTAPSVEPDRVTHGFYVTRVQGILSLLVYESGAAVFGPRLVQPGDLLDVIRRGSTIFYRHQGVVVYTSRVASSGTIKVAASLYGPEDTVG